MNSNIEFYNKNADSYFSETINLDMSEWIERFISYIPEGGRILDAGCGSGRDSKIFISKGFSVVAFDGSKEMCLRASEYIGQNVINMCFEDITYKNEFDGIWACASLLHVSQTNLNAILKRLHAGLKANGALYASFKYGNNSVKKGERFFLNFTEETLSKIFIEAGFKVIVTGISSDQRHNNESVYWMNIICKK